MQLEALALFRTCTVVTSLVITAISAGDSVHAEIISFGTGSNAFNMNFTTIGSPGNAADTTGNPNPAGAVSYTYKMGTYEVSEDMITKFNASQSLQITKDTRGVNMPATNVSWNEGARFVNWLNTSTGGVAAYKFTTNGVNDDIALWSPSDAGYNSANLFRNSLATYVLPSMDEWYKAAYYDPSSSTYFDFPNGSNTAPTAVSSGTAANTAVYDRDFDQGPAEITLAGGLSPFGIMGLGGNVVEWLETAADLNNNSGSEDRGWRGSNWFQADLSSSDSFDSFPTGENNSVGFRVARLSVTAVPEPGSLVVLSVMGLAVLWSRGRKRK